MSRIQLNCGQNRCECCANFHVVYFRFGMKETIKERLPKETGFTIMQKKARMMPVGFMAHAVHPEDAKHLI